MEVAAWTAHERAAFGEVFQCFDVGAVGDRRVGDPERRCEFPDLVAQVGLDPGVDVLGVDVGLLGDGQRRLLIDPLRVTDHRAQVEPLLRGSASEVDETVLGLGHPRHREPPRVSPGPAEHLEVGHRVIGQAKDLGLQHRQVYEVPALSGLHRVAAPKPRRHGCGARVGPRQILADLPANEDRRSFRQSAPQPDDSARPRLQREFGCGPVSPGTFETERGDRGDGQVRLRTMDRRGCESLVFSDFRTRGPDHRVRGSPVSGRSSRCLRQPSGRRPRCAWTRTES